MINITPKYDAVEETRQRLRKHIDSFWPDNTKECLTYSEEPVKDLLPGWRVIEVAPNEANAPWVYVTLGAWEITKDEIYEKGRYGLEFLITSPRKDFTNVISLAMAAIYHANPRYRIKLGDTLEIGREWLEKSSCDHFIVSLPYPFSPDLETVKINDIYISFWWLLPITKSEALYAQANGQEALWDRFESVGLDYLDINRQSVV
ncbi:MAG: suppressor of fused domain protein [Nitrososphaerales archaeon]